MKARILLTSCPHCHKPLAAVTVGDSHAAQWYAIADNVIDLAGDALTWCPDCQAPLPVGASGNQLPEAGEVTS